VKLFIAAFFVCVPFAASFAQDTLIAPDPPEKVNDLYFCRSYTDKENGRGSIFIVSADDTDLVITAMVRLTRPIGVSHVYVKVFRTGEGDKDAPVFTQDYDIEAASDYIHLADISLQRKPGVSGNKQVFQYYAVVYNDAGAEIIRNSFPLTVKFVQ